VTVSKHIGNSAIFLINSLRPSKYRLRTLKDDH
jgi:hypothetical protein